MNDIKKHLKTRNCRVCGQIFFPNPLWQHRNMPMVAQYLPDIHSLSADNGENLTVYQCSGCGLVQLNNKAVHYYKEVVRAAGVSEEMKAFRLKQFNDFVQRYLLKDKKVIEIGCGRGEYLTLLDQCGVKASGLEYSSLSVSECLKNGSEVFHGFVENKNYLPIRLSHNLI